MSTAERVERSVTDLQRSVQSIQSAMGALRAAHEANDPRRWEAVRSSLEGQLEAATRSCERAMSQTSNADPEVSTRLNEVGSALASMRHAPELGHVPTGFAPVASEAALIGLLTNPVEGSAHLGFARREAEFMHVVDGLEPLERRELSRRLRVRLPHDALATSFATRFTGERQQRLLTHVASSTSLLRSAQVRLAPTNADTWPTPAEVPAPAAPPSTDARVHAALRDIDDPPGAAHLFETLSTLDATTRADLLGRYEAYRPGLGDEIAARLRRLDGAMQRDVITSLRAPGPDAVRSMEPGLHVGRSIQVGRGTALAAPAPAHASPAVRAAVASLRAAEYEFDAGVSEVREAAAAARTGGSTNVLGRLEYHARTGLQHLTYARDNVGAVDRAGFSGLETQMNETSLALEALLPVAMGLAGAAQVTTVFDGVLAGHAELRTHLGMAARPTQVARREERKADDHYESGAVEPALELAHLQAEQLLHSVADTPATDAETRATMLANGASGIDPHLRYALSMLRRLDSHQRAPHAGAVERVTEPVAGIMRWARGRPASGLLTHAMAEVERLVDAARGIVGLGPITKRLVENVIDGEVKEGSEEMEAVNAAASDLRDAYDGMKDFYLAGMREFEKHISIKEVTPPSFWVEVGKAALVAGIGYVSGGLGGLVLGHGLASAAGTAAEAGIRGLVQNLMVDATQGIAGKVADDAFSDGGEEAVRQRLFARFVRGFELHAAESAMAAKMRVTALVRSHVAERELLVNLKKAVDAARQDAPALVLQNAGQAWASLLSRCALGAAPSVGGESSAVTDMSRFFGNREHSDPRFAHVGGTDPKSGKVDGVLQLSMTVVDEHGEGPGAVRIDAADVVGFDRSVSLMMLRDHRAGYRALGEIQMPMAISLWRGSSSALFALDEQGTLRDSLRWDMVRRWSQDGSERAPEPRFYEEPGSLLRVLRQARLSAAVIK